MGLTIDFDCQAAVKAREVDDISAARKLAAEAKALGTFPQLLPEYNFRQRQLPPKPASKTNILI